MGDAREIEFRTRRYRVVTETAKKLAGLSGKEFEDALDWEFIHYFKQAYELEKSSGNSFKTVVTSSVAADHARAYGNNYEYLDKAIAGFKEVVEPFKDRVIDYLDRQEKARKKKEKEDEATIRAREKEVDAVIKELYAYIPKGMRFVVDTRRSKYDPKSVTSNKIELGLDGSDEDLRTYKAVLVAFKLCEEKRFDEVKSAIAEEYAREVAAREAGDKKRSIFNEKMVMAVGGSDFDEILSPYVEELYVEAHGEEGKEHLKWCREILERGRHQMGLGQ